MDLKQIVLPMSMLAITVPVDINFFLPSKPWKESWPSWHRRAVEAEQNFIEQFGRKITCQ